MTTHKLPALLVAAIAVLAIVPGAASAQTPVQVALTEAPPSVTSQPASVAAGDVTIQANNVGAIEHELVVIRTDLAADALPESGGAVDLGQLDVVADTDPFAAGESRTLDANLTAGDYVLICNVPGHYGLGMRAAFTATGAAASADAAGQSPAPAAAGDGGFADGDAASPVVAVLIALLAVGVAAGGALTALRRQS